MMNNGRRWKKIILSANKKVNAKTKSKGDSTTPQSTKQTKRQILKFKKANWEQINVDMNSISEEIKNSYNTGKSANDLWEMFKDSLKLSISKNIPSSSSRPNTKLPWINKQILKLLDKKKRAYNKAKSTNNWSTYRKLQKLARNTIRKAEWKYMNDTILKGLENNNNKPFWNFVKSRKKDNTGVSPLKQEGKLFSDPKSKANILLKQFKSVFTVDNSSDLPAMKTKAPSWQVSTKS